MGLIKLNQRLQDPELAPWFANIFPRDNPKNMRFSINFFTSIGLGGLTDALREHLAALPKILAEQRAAQAAAQQGMPSPLPHHFAPLAGLLRSCTGCELTHVFGIANLLKLQVLPSNLITCVCWGLVTRTGITKSRLPRVFPHQRIQAHQIAV